MILVFAGLLVSGLADAAAPHSITYEKKSAVPGATLNISGVEFKIIRVPIRDFNGNKYIITLPVQSVGGLIFGNVSTTHSTDPIGANLQIDGFDALVQVSDGRSYTLASDLSDPGTNHLVVQGHALAIVRIQVGTMVVDLSEFFESNDPLTSQPPDTDVNIGASFNAVNFAEWWKWTDPVTQINALNLWIDYVRIFAL
jgi:hypothetical protein